MSQSKVNLPVSNFSSSICAKVPEFRRTSTVANALWILRNPIRLTPLEKNELITLVQSNLIGGAK
jgi:hypothetical protein